MTSESGSSPSKNSPIGTLNALAKRDRAAMLIETLHRSTFERKLLLMFALVATCSKVSRRLSRSSRICLAISCSGISMVRHAGLGLTSRHESVDPTSVYGPQSLHVLIFLYGYLFESHLHSSFYTLFGDVSRISMRLRC